jgi:hypothetical protein
MGEILLAEGIEFDDGDTIAIGDGVNETVTFELDSVENAGLTASDHKGIDFEPSATNVDLAQLIAAAINGQGGNLFVSAEMTASEAKARVALTSDLPGELGNVKIVIAAGNLNLSVSGMSGGKAVRCRAPATCLRAEDCETHTCGADGLCAD